MITQLSILIPVYNSACLYLVRRLHALCEQVEQPFDYEIVVADDGSDKSDIIRLNEQVNSLPHCRLLLKAENSGSAATRNYLAANSRYPWLLFIDCDMHLPDDDYLSRYLVADQYDVVNGGISIARSNRRGGNLRYRYERHCEPAHTPERRNKDPFREFRSTNFLIRRTCFERCPFDERYRKSGYEDVAFGRSLSLAGATILHIDNPVCLQDFEPNGPYLLKLERQWQTLHRFSSDLEGYSGLLDLTRKPWFRRLRPLIARWHRVMGPLERRNLIGKHPSIAIFYLYKLGYFVNIH